MPNAFLMNYWPTISCALLGMGIVMGIVPLILRPTVLAKLSHRWRDLHHTHLKPIPRVGGLALAVAFLGVELLAMVMWPGQTQKLPVRWVVLLSSLAMFMLGFWDDLKPLGAKRKLLGQVLIATAVCAFGVEIQQFTVPFSATILPLGGWGTLLTIFWLVGMTNLINLIDGVDGLAAGICLMLMVLLAYVGHQGGSFGLLASGMAGALLAFLWFNFPPARIYLGDGGAYFLGFQIGLFAIVSSHKGTVFAALIAPLFALALPIVDTVLAILRRGLRGLPIFRPDRRHIHHHLLNMGLSRRKVVLSIYAVTLVFMLMGFVAFWSHGNLIPVLLGVATLILLICAGKLHFSRNWFAVGRVVGNSLEMRQEIQYALTLMHWLAFEGKRAHSVEELWMDLVFAAQRLGYNSVRMTLADGERAWQQADAASSTHRAVHTLQGGRFGTLELKAVVCLDAKYGAKSPLKCGKRFCPCVSSAKVFEIVSELLAEGWVKGLSALKMNETAPARFDDQPAVAVNRPHPRHSIFSNSAPAPAAHRQPDISQAGTSR
ncbi:MAG TPA: MraY family glycosyltransferase [Verrucomicrobiota bacterium]|nr:MraY family glycosyltransferase [Verrucomicrobiota bacterium]HRR64408.1 MraY family glycosyltransferase [Candidatus Paceibacterota bacterium]